MDIEKNLLPTSGSLIIEDEVATAKVFDAELDVLDCSFNNDDSVHINTDGFSFITLDSNNLELLSKLIFDAKEYYEKTYK